MGLCCSKRGLTLTEKEEILIIEAEQQVKYKEKNNQVVDFNELYKTKGDSWDEFELHFALIGSSESGKSSFIDALNG